MKKFLLVLSAITQIALGMPNESSSLPIINSFSLPKTMNINAYKTMTTTIKPKTNQLELAIFSLKSGKPNFTGQIVTLSTDVLKLESVDQKYFPLAKTETVENCNFNTNGTISCFHPNSLVIEDNKIHYQFKTMNSKIESQLDTGVMGAGVKFFAATNYESSGDPTKFIGISNDTYKQQLSWLNCDRFSSCEVNKIKIKPSVRTISNFQILDNKLYFIVNYNTLVTIDITDNSYKVHQLDVYNASAFAIDKDLNLYVINSIGNIRDNMPGSFAISKCNIDNGKCETMYIENSNPLRFSRFFMGVDNKNIYLLANKDKDNLTLNSNLSIITINKK